MRSVMTLLLSVVPGCFDPTNHGEIVGSTAGASSGSTDGADPASTVDTSPESSAGAATSAMADAGGLDDTATSGTPATETATDDTGDATGDATTESTPDVGADACDSFAADCPAGFKCNAHADDGGDWWNAWSCVPIAAVPVGIGEACQVEGDVWSGLDDCDAGGLCWDVDPDSGVGECVEYCSGSARNPICDDPTRACGIVDVPNLCIATCDPLVQDCAAERGCVPIDDFFACVRVTSGGGDAADDCDHPNDCNPGLFCATVDAVPGCSGSASGCCSEFCDTTDPNASMSCNGAQACVAWYDEGQAPPGYESVGACMVP
ncbi:MAG TPA: ribulose phosphate epimerase [Nannocystaceae bacterium]|nr:ribulose phosphate epimerase [Nannocystaceae bacterium]